MPDAQAYPHRAHLKQQILARVAAGETVAAVCAEAAMPCAASVQVWRRKDAGFAAELAAARRRGDFARRLAFDEAKAAALLAGLAQGKAVASLLGRPGLPSQAAYRYWRRTDPGFQAALWRFRTDGYRRRSGSGHGRWRAWDEAVADRILLAAMRGAPLRKLLGSDPGFPSLAVLARWRSEQPVWDRALKIAFQVGRRARAPVRWTPELTDEICQRIVCGDSLRGVGRDPAMPCAGTLYAWAARWPWFTAEVARACDIREWWYEDQMLDICLRNGPFRLAATKREAAPLQRQLNRLAKRPGWKRARDERAARARD